MRSGRSDDRQGKAHQARYRRGGADARRAGDLAPRNIGKIFRSMPGPGFSGICEERRPPFDDDVIRYYGQYIALAVAETFETAKAAADAVARRMQPKSRTSNCSSRLTTSPTKS